MGKLLIPDFNEKYGLGDDYIATLKSTGGIPKSIISGSRGNYYIEENYFVKRKEFKRKVNLFNQDMYYYVTEHYLESEYAEAVSEYTGCSKTSIITWLARGLFSPDKTTLLNYKIPNSEWNLFKFNRMMIQRLSKYTRKINGKPSKNAFLVKNGTKNKIADVGYLLDRRAGLIN